MSELSSKQLERYSRNIKLAGIGTDGQLKLLSSKVLVIGAGGLGSIVSLYLAAAGVGTIGIADGDKVDLTNLQRQLLHFTSDLDRMKVNSAQEKLTALNPDIKINSYNLFVDESNITELISGYDFIIDGTDNLTAKFLINDACVKSNKSYSHGGILGYAGQAMTYTPGSVCYNCVFKEEPVQGSVPGSNEIGVLGAVAGILGSIQVAEAVKYLTGVGELLTNQLLSYDAQTMDFRKVKLKKDDNCLVCRK